MTHLNNKLSMHPFITQLLVAAVRTLTHQDKVSNLFAVLDVRLVACPAKAHLVSSKDGACLGNFDSIISRMCWL